MKAQAIEKIKAEMAANQNNGYFKAVGDYLLNHLEKHPGDAGKIMAEDKTIAKSFKAMEDIARQRKTGNSACIPPDEGFKIVLDYYGIKAEEQKPASTGSFDVSLDSLLGG